MSRDQQLLVRPVQVAASREGLSIADPMALTQP